MSKKHFIIEGVIDDTKDEFGCVKVAVQLDTGIFDDAKETSVGICQQSRKPSKALAYALESLAEYLKKS